MTSSASPRFVYQAPSPSNSSVIPSPPKVPPPRPPPGVPRMKSSPGSLFSRSGVTPSKTSDVYPVSTDSGSPISGHSAQAATSSGASPKKTMKKLISSFVKSASGSLGGGNNPSSPQFPRDNVAIPQNVESMSPLGSVGPSSSRKVVPKTVHMTDVDGDMGLDKLQVGKDAFDIAVMAPRSTAPTTAIPVSLQARYDDDCFNDDFANHLNIDVPPTSPTKEGPSVLSPNTRKLFKLPGSSPKTNVSPFSSSKPQRAVTPAPAPVISKEEEEITLTDELLLAARRMAASKQNKPEATSLSRPLVTPMITTQKTLTHITTKEAGAPSSPNGLCRTSSFELRNAYRPVVSAEKKRSNEGLAAMHQSAFDVTIKRSDEIALSRSFDVDIKPTKANQNKEQIVDEETWTVIHGVGSSKETVTFKNKLRGDHHHHQQDHFMGHHHSTNSTCSSRKTSTESDSLLSLGSSSGTATTSSRSLRTPSDEFSQRTFHSAKSGSLVSIHSHEHEEREFKEEDDYDDEEDSHASTTQQQFHWSVGLPAPPPSAIKKTTKRIRTTYCLDDFDFGVTLGTGSFGRVRFAQFRDPIPQTEEEHIRLAIKILRKDCVKRLNQVEHIKHEKAILEMLVLKKKHEGVEFYSEDEPWMPRTRYHPFIVQLFGTFQTETCLFMVLEFIRGGEFFCHLRMRGHFKNKEAMFYTASVASAFAFLHRQDVAYRDLKPENLMLDHEGYLKVVDFGFAKHIPDNKTYTLCGTPEYIAPEVLLNQGHGKGVDWWALGILTYEMLSGVAPFTDADPMSIYQKIVRGNVQYPVYFDADARSFLKRLLQVDTNKRYGCLAAGSRDVMEHRWLSGVDFELLLARKATPPVVPFTSSPDDTSCFEEYPDSADVDLYGVDAEPYYGGGDFPHFDVVCM